MDLNIYIFYGYMLHVMRMVWLGWKDFFCGGGGGIIFVQGGFVFFAVQTDLSAKYKQGKLFEVQATII